MKPIHIFTGFVLFSASLWANPCRTQADLVRQEGCTFTAPYDTINVSNHNYRPPSAGSYYAPTFRPSNFSQNILRSSVDIRVKRASGSDRFLQKAVIVVSPFDPTGSTTHDKMVYAINTGDWSNMTEQMDHRYRLAEKLLANGYDIVTLNFAVESRKSPLVNGIVAAKAIEFLNQLRGNTGVEKMTLSGFSMGGVIARVALNYLEAQQIDHQIHTYISYDSPHRGAHMPPSLQILPQFLEPAMQRAEHRLARAQKAGNRLGRLSNVVLKLLDFSTFNIFELHKKNQHEHNTSQSALQGFNPEDAEANILGILNKAWLGSQVAAEVLINSLNPTKDSSAHLAHYRLLRSLDSMGYPKKTRNVTFTNGSVTGKKVVENVPSSTIPLYYNMKYKIASGVEEFGMVLQVQQTLKNQNVFFGYVFGPDGSKLWSRETYRIQYLSAPYLPMDFAPGSWAPTYQVVADSFSALVEPVLPSMNAAVSKHMFIPTYSALDIDLKTLNNNFQQSLVQFGWDKFQYEELAQLSPFDVIYHPGDENELHLEMKAWHANAFCLEVTSNNGNICPGNYTYDRPVVNPNKNLPSFQQRMASWNQCVNSYCPTTIPSPGRQSCINFGAIPRCGNQPRP
jgi:pimeloyl-ACP methyl ester carboxylesterase